MKRYLLGLFAILSLCINISWANELGACLLPLSGTNDAYAKSFFLEDNPKQLLGILIEWNVTQPDGGNPVLFTTLDGGNSFISTQGIKFAPTSTQKPLTELMTFAGQYENSAGISLGYAFNRYKETHNWTFEYGEPVTKEDGLVTMTPKEIKTVCRIDYESPGKEPVTYYTTEISSSDKTVLDNYFKKIAKSTYNKVLKSKRVSSSNGSNSSSGSSSSSGSLPNLNEGGIATTNTDSDYYYCAFHGTDYVNGKPRTRYVTMLVTDNFREKSRDDSKEAKTETPVEDRYVAPKDRVLQPRVSSPFDLMNYDLAFTFMVVSITDGSKASLALNNLKPKPGTRPDPEAKPHTFLTFTMAEQQPKTDGEVMVAAGQLDIPEELKSMRIFSNATKEIWEVVGQYKKDQLSSRNALCYKLRTTVGGGVFDQSIIRASELAMGSWRDK
jgi:hypothetical protein